MQPVASHRCVFKANMFITFLQMGLAKRRTAIVGYSSWSWKYQALHSA